MKETNKEMKIKKFDVVELKDNNRATILDNINKNEYLAEIVNPYGITIETKSIKDEEISKIIYEKT